MSYAAIIGGVAQIVGGYLSSRGSRSNVPEGGFYEPLDLEELDKLMRETSRRNIVEGMATEAEFRPEFAGMRGEADAAMRQRLGRAQAGMGDTDALRQRLMQDLMGPDQGIEFEQLQQSPLMDAAYARALSDLELGGALPRDIQNLVTRTAMARGGTAPGMGRQITARDLGRTSQDLSQQRLGTAATLGQFQTGVNQGQQALRDSINRFNVQLREQRTGQRQQGLGMLEDLGFRDFSTALGATLGTALPTTGMDAGTIADLTIADRQAQAQAMQQAAAAQAAARSGKASGIGSMIGGAGSILGGLFGG